MYLLTYLLTYYLRTDVFCMFYFQSLCMASVPTVMCTSTSPLRYDLVLTGYTPDFIQFCMTLRSYH